MLSRSPLTVKSIEALSPRKERYEVRDWAEPGLYVVVYPTGAKPFVWRYSFANKPRKLVIGPVSLADARRRAREARNIRDDGTDPAVQKQAAKITQAEAARREEAAVRRAGTAASDDVGAVVENFITRHCSKLRTGDDVARALRKDVAEPWQGRRLSEIDRADVNELMDRIVDRGAPIYANRVHAYLSKLCRWAVGRGLIASNPCIDVAKPAQETSRERALSDRELLLVWQAADCAGYPFGDITKLLMLTGQRKSEISDATWSEVDLDEALLRLPGERTKNKRAHDCPLSPQALSIIERLPRMVGERDLLFTTNGKSAVSGFSRAKRNLDAAIAEMNGGQPIPEWKFHDLRRSVATGMGALGVDLVVIERVLKHISGSFSGVVGIYQRQKYETEMRAALETWGRHLQQLTGEPAEDNVASLAGRA